MAEILIKCKICGHQNTTESPCRLTGWEYSEGWVTKCPQCQGEMKKVERPQGHVSECEKVLNKIERYR